MYSTTLRWVSTRAVSMSSSEMNTVVPLRRPRPTLLAHELGGGVAAAEAKRPRLVAAFGARHDLAASAELLERQQPDRLLAERSVVAGLGRLDAVTVIGLAGTGDLRLDLIDNDSIVSNGLALRPADSTNGSLLGQSYAPSASPPI